MAVLCYNFGIMAARKGQHSTTKGRYAQGFPQETLGPLATFLETIEGQEKQSKGLPVLFHPLKNIEGKAGRPTVWNEVVAAKIEYAASIGCSNREIALFSGISENTLQRWLNEIDGLRERVEMLKEQPVVRARTIVHARMHESYSNAMDYLKRKKRDEFGDSVDIRALERPMLLGKEDYTLLDEPQAPTLNESTQNDTTLDNEIREAL